MVRDDRTPGHRSAVGWTSKPILTIRLIRGSQALNRALELGNPTVQCACSASVSVSRVCAASITAQPRGSIPPPTPRAAPSAH